MINDREELASLLLLPSSIEVTSTAANGSGWSLTYNCLIVSHVIYSVAHTTFPNGFLIRLQLFHALLPLYIFDSSFVLDSSIQLLHFSPSHFSSYSSVHHFVLSTLSQLGVPASDPDPLARLIFSFTRHHQQAAAATVVPLHVSFTSTTVLRNYAEAVDWLHGGTAQSCVVRTIRSTSEALRRLKDESFDGSSLLDETCTVCLEGFLDQQDQDVVMKKSASRLPCSHLFHLKCVSQWLTFDHRCPVCRSPMPWVEAHVPEFTTTSTTSYHDLQDDDANFPN